MGLKLTKTSAVTRPVREDELKDPTLSVPLSHVRINAGETITLWLSPSPKVSRSYRVDVSVHDDGRMEVHAPTQTTTPVDRKNNNGPE